MATHGTEVLVNGTRQGAKVKRKEGLPLGSKSRCAPAPLTYCFTLTSILLQVKTL